MSSFYTNKMSEARRQLVVRHPFWSGITLGLQMEPSDDFPTMATDGARIWYNREWVEKLTLEEVMGVIAHESAHCGFLHPFRTKEHHDKALSNLAQDMAINIILKDDGLVLPGKPCTFEQFYKGEVGFLYDPKWKGMSWEEIYSKMPKPPQGGQGGQGKCPVHGTGKGTGQPGGKGNECTCKGQGKGLSCKDIVPNDSVAEETDAKIKTQQALAAARMRGTVPAGVAGLVEGLLEVKVNWKDLLRAKLKSRTKDDYNPRKHNRRLVGSDIYFPSLDGTATGEIHVAVDTSGSTYGDRQKFLSELVGIATEVRPSKLTVSFCDAKVWDVREFGPSEYDLLKEGKMDFPGGGGTSFKPPFDWIREHQRIPETMVYFTDMYGDFPSEPEWETIWLSTSDIDKAPFGTVIKYDEPADEQQ